MTQDPFTPSTARPATPEAPPAPRQPQTTHTRLPTIGESACSVCGFAACFFQGAMGWCWACRPESFVGGVGA